MKIGSAGRVDEIFVKGQKGLEFTPEPHPPRAVPEPGRFDVFSGQSRFAKERMGRGAEVVDAGHSPQSEWWQSCHGRISEGSIR